MKKLKVLIIALSSIWGATKINAQVVGVSIGIAPPELPVYSQPPCSNDGYLWSPGYWAYGSGGYYWVPGVWVAPPQEGFLWTPGYWGFVNGGYFWNDGYWGTHVGFYGGVCYGSGYGGSGFYGGRWEGSRFQYNSAAWHVGGGIHNTYSDRTVINNTGTRSSFNGPGGVTRQPTENEQAVAKENHTQPTASQQSHQQQASTNKNQLASVNHGNPATTARTTVGGDRYNATGHSVSTIHANPASNHAANSSAANHLANPSHTNTPKPQQHSAVQQKPATQPQRNQQKAAAQPQHSQQKPAAQPQHSQQRPAAQPQHNNAPKNVPQRQSQPARAPSGGGGHSEGGGHEGGGGGEGGRH